MSEVEGTASPGPGPGTNKVVNEIQVQQGSASRRLETAGWFSSLHVENATFQVLPAFRTKWMEHCVTFLYAFTFLAALVILCLSYSGLAFKDEYTAEQGRAFYMRAYLRATHTHFCSPHAPPVCMTNLPLNGTLLERKDVTARCELTEGWGRTIQYHFHGDRVFSQQPRSFLSISSMGKSSQLFSPVKEVLFLRDSDKQDYFNYFVYKNKTKQEPLEYTPLKFWYSPWFFFDNETQKGAPNEYLSASVIADFDKDMAALKARRADKKYAGTMNEILCNIVSDSVNLPYCRSLFSASPMAAPPGYNAAIIEVLRQSGAGDMSYAESGKTMGSTLDYFILGQDDWIQSSLQAVIGTRSPLQMTNDMYDSHVRVFFVQAGSTQDYQCLENIQRTTVNSYYGMNTFLWLVQVLLVFLGGIHAIHSWQLSVTVSRLLYFFARSSVPGLILLQALYSLYQNSMELVLLSSCINPIKVACEMFFISALVAVVASRALFVRQLRLLARVLVHALITLTFVSAFMVEWLRINLSDFYAAGSNSSMCGETQCYDLTRGHAAVKLMGYPLLIIAVISVLIAVVDIVNSKRQGAKKRPYKVGDSASKEPSSCLLAFEQSCVGRSVVEYFDDAPVHAHYKLIDVEVAYYLGFLRFRNIVIKNRDMMPVIACMAFPKVVVDSINVTTTYWTLLGTRMQDARNALASDVVLVLRRGKKEDCRHLD